MKNSFGEEIPEKLYKYMSWRQITDTNTGEVRNYTKELLENNQFYLSPLSTLNDPFDSGINPNFNCDKKTFLESQMKRPFISNQEIEQLKISLKNMSKATFTKKMNANNYIDSLKTKVGITCFSKNGIKDKNNILMWSHYADSHKGICLVFDTNFDWAVRLYKVAYMDTYPNLEYYKLIQEPMNSIEKIYKIKSDVWEYEAEYRLIRRSKEGFEFPSESLKEIICGCAFTDFNKIEQALRNRNSPVKLYKAIKEIRKFQLKKEFIGCYGGHRP